MTQLPHYAQKYRIKGNRLYETVAGKNGTFERLLCNFVSWITAEITLDDGAETTTWIRLRGIHESGRTLPEIEIPAADLAGFNRLAQRWGMDCILEVGKAVKDCVRHAIQTTAANAEKKTVFAVTGWKKIGEEWYYLMPGDDNHTVDLHGKLHGYSMERQCDALDIQTAGCLLRMMPTPEEVMFPLLAFTFLSPLNHFLKEAGCEPKFVLFLVGKTGSRKSTLAALMLSFFGKFTASELPLSFRDTANSILHNAFSLKDVLTVIDDLHPSSRQEEQKMNGTAQAVHSHFVINSVNCDTGKKYHSNKESLTQLMEASDKLCLQYGLSVVKPKPKQKTEHTMSDREYRAYDKGQSWKLNLEINIDECMTLARDREHFIRLMEYSGYEVRWEDTRKYITYTTPEGHKCRDIKLNGLKYHKEEMEYEFRIRAEICRRNAAGAEGYDFESRSSTAHGSRDGTELERPDRLAESAGENLGRDSGEVRYPYHRRTAAGTFGNAASDSAFGWESQRRSDGAVPADDDAGSKEHRINDDGIDQRTGETGWEPEREVWESHLTGAGTDEEYFEEAVLDLDDTQPDFGNLGTGVAYLAADLSNIVDHKPVEDSTTKHFRPERKRRTGPTMGGM